MLVGMVDAKMVGAIEGNAFGYSGTEAQAAVGLANNFYSVLLVLAIGISYGITPLVAAADASGDQRTKAEGLKNSFLINFVTSTIIFLILYFSTSLLYHLDQTPEVVKLAIPFLNVMLFGLIPLSIFFTIKQFAEGLSMTIIAMLISLAGNLLNVLLNWILIFGHWGFEPMGLQGACWATFISRTVMSIGMFLFLYYDKRFNVIWEEWKKVRLNWGITKKMLNTGMATGMQWVFEVAAFSIAGLMMGWISATTQAAHLVALNIAAFTYMFASGISAATSVRVGNQVGKKNSLELRRSAFSGLHLSFVFMILCMLVLFFFRDPIAAAFSDDPEVIVIASSMLFIAAIFQLFDGLQVVALGALRGMNDNKIPTWIALLTYWVISLPCCYYLAFTLGYGAEGIWYGLSIGLFAAAVMQLYRFNYISKRIV